MTIFAAFYADDTSRGFLHSHSYTGNALACRAALAVLDIFRDRRRAGRQSRQGRALDGARGRRSQRIRRFGISGIAA